MPTKNHASKTTVSFDSPEYRAYVQSVGINEIADAADEQFETPNTPACKAFERLYRDLLERDGEANLARTLGDLDGFWAIPAAARKAGFILGFEYCRRLLAGGAR